MNFDLPKGKVSIIKVIGAGGGGSNAVNYMFKQGIKDVDFIVCNTDRQVLDSSPVPLKIQLGVTLTEGLGAGSLPEVGKKAALENIEDIKNVLSRDTKMLFITAGLGGGTGTGAAPVIAQLAQEFGILTVSIVTLPFSWEGNLRRKQAEDGLNELKKYSDAVLVILNDKLREIYHTLKVSEAFSHADDVLCSAAKSIAEIINVTLRINVDFNDVRRVMEKSGVAIMGSASASGEGRSLKAVTQALNSPLLNDNNIYGARYVLVSITCGSGKDELTMDELAEITDYIQESAGQTAELIKGYGVDESLGEKVNVTIIASGFTKKDNLGFETPVMPEVKIMHLEDAVKPVEEKTEQKDEQKNEQKDEPKIELKNITEPTLKSDIISEKKDEDEKTELLIKEEKQKNIEEKKLIDIHNIQEVESHHIQEIESRYAQELKSRYDQELASRHAQENSFQTSKNKKNEENISDEETSSDPFLIIKPEEQISFEFEIPKASVSHTPDSSVEQQSELNGQSQKKKEPIIFSPPIQIRKLETPPAVSVLQHEVKQTPTPSQENIPIVSSDDMEKRAMAQEKIQKLRELSFKLKTPGGLTELESEPAYKRRNVSLNDIPHSSESEISRFTLGEGEDKKPTLRPDNSFLHDKPD
ncbi:MAG: cell division protein FtsZ [Bacteroidota bacterium]